MVRARNVTGTFMKQTDSILRAQGRSMFFRDLMSIFMLVVLGLSTAGAVAGPKDGEDRAAAAERVNSIDPQVLVVPPPTVREKQDREKELPPTDSVDFDGTVEDMYRVVHFSDDIPLEHE